jgi:hypothetical protein
MADLREGTAENAEIAEPSFLCGLCELGGFFFVVTPALRREDGRACAALK